MDSHPSASRRAVPRLFTLVLAACAGVASLRPALVPGWATALGARIADPLSAVAELGSPLRLLRLRRIQAAEGALVRRADLEAREQEEIRRALVQAALPRAPELVEGRRPCPLEVLGRAEGNRDRLRVRTARGALLRKGLPVALGDVYVGRVAEVFPYPGDGGAEAWIDLVTAPDFHVGGRVRGRDGEPDVLLTAGGATERAGELWISARHPSDRSVREGRVRVFEHFLDADPFAHLSEGLVLGRLVGAPEASQWWIEPAVDYVDGLYELVALAPQTEGPAGDAPPSRRGLVGEHWRRTRARTFGDANPWRHTTRIPLGSRDGVEVGAAVTGYGGRFLGRVLRVGPSSSHVALLADPGFSLVAVARFEGQAEPRVLGRLVSRGPVGPGEVRFDWRVRATERELENLGGSGRARLYTGSGERGLPAGLFVGEASFGSRKGRRREVVVRTEVQGEDVHTLFVRLPPPALTGGREGP